MALCLPPPAQATQSVINWARDRFERVQIIALVRDNSLDQAISKAVANSCQVWHSSDTIKGLKDQFDYTSERFHMEILKALPLFIKQKNIIREIANDNADITTLLHYDGIVGDPDNTLMRIVSHANSLGFSPLDRPGNRTLKKLVDSD